MKKVILFILLLIVISVGCIYADRPDRFGIVGQGSPFSFQYLRMPDETYEDFLGVGGKIGARYIVQKVDM